MRTEAFRVSPRCRSLHVILRQHASVPGVLEGEQSGARKVLVIRLHRLLEHLKRQAAIGRIDHRLRLNRAENSRAATLVFVGMRFHADQIFITALAMREQGDQVGLGSTGYKQSACEPEFGRETLLQGTNGRILPIDVITDFGRRHGRSHGRSRLGDGVTAQVDDLHADTIRKVEA